MARRDIDSIKVVEYVRYDSASGLFYWIQNRDASKVGTVAGAANSQGYITISICGRSYLAHRLAWVFHYGEQPPEIIDHINRKCSDNRITNLRAATHSENMRNIGRRDGKRYKGITWSSRHKLWTANIRIGGKTLYLGRAKYARDAAALYDAAVKLYYPECEFSFLNLKQ